MYKKSRTAQTPSLFRGVTQHMDDRKLREIYQKKMRGIMYFFER